MFVGELLCLGFYYLQAACSKKKKSHVDEPMSPGTQVANTVQLKTTINPLILAIPAACDVCGSTLMNIALTMCAGSIYQMMRGIIVLIVAAFAMIFLKKKQYVHHYSSLAVIFIGVFMVGLSSLLFPDSGAASETKPLGIILIIIAQFFAAT